VGLDDGDVDYGRIDRGQMEFPGERHHWNVARSTGVLSPTPPLKSVVIRDNPYGLGG
jgi:hypothetical protein